MGKGKLGWAITGAGHEIQAIWDVMAGMEDVEVFLSRAAEEVLRMYKIDISSFPGKVHYDKSACTPICGQFATGQYRGLLVAPASSNSVAKFVTGISDNLVTNIFAQAGKGRVPIVVYPTDVAPEMDTLSPTGMVKVYPRTIDLENTDRLGMFDDVSLARSLDEMKMLAEALFL